MFNCTSKSVVNLVFAADAAKSFWPSQPSLIISSFKFIAASEFFDSSLRLLTNDNDVKTASYDLHV